MLVLSLHIIKIWWDIFLWMKLPNTVYASWFYVMLILLILLCLTGLLRLWLYAVSFSDSHHCDRLCDNRGNIFLIECWKLPLAMDIIFLSCLDSCLCVLVFDILLLREDKDVRVLPNQLLFWIHFDVLSWFRNSLRWVYHEIKLFRFLHPFCTACVLRFQWVDLIGFGTCRSCWLSRFKSVCEEDLQKHQVRLEVERSKVDPGVLPWACILVDDTNKQI